MTRTCIFVSGYAAPGIEWCISPLTNLLRCYDWNVKVFRSGLGCPEERADDIARFVARTRGDIFAVGHSMGGVVCEALDVLTGRIDSVATLGSPLGGVPLLHLLPRWAATVGMNQLRERSKCLERIRGQEHSARYLSIAGSRDPVVTRASAFAIPHCQTAIVPSGHSELFMRKDVARIVGNFFGVAHEWDLLAAA